MWSYVGILIPCESNQKNEWRIERRTIGKTSQICDVIQTANMEQMNTSLLALDIAI